MQTIPDWINATRKCALLKIFFVHFFFIFSSFYSFFSFFSISSFLEHNKYIEFAWKGFKSLLHENIAGVQYIWYFPKLALLLALIFTSIFIRHIQRLGAFSGMQINRLNAVLRSQSTIDHALNVISFYVDDFPPYFVYSFLFLLYSTNCASLIFHFLPIYWITSASIRQNQLTTTDS